MPGNPRLYQAQVLGVRTGAGLPQQSGPEDLNTRGREPDSSSIYGDYIPVVYGRARVQGAIIWAKSFELVESTQLSVVSTRLRDTFAVAFCRGPVRLLRVWFNENLVVGGRDNIINYQFYRGDETQIASNEIVFDGQIPVGYRGLAYMICREVYLQEYGNSLPAITAEVEFEDAGDIRTIYRNLLSVTRLPEEDINVPSQTTALSGYTVTEESTARELINTLRYITALDVVEADNGVQVSSRTQRPIVTIDVEETLEDESETREEGLDTITLEKTPSEVIIQYQDIEEEPVQEKTEYARRLSGRGNFKINNIRIPAVMTRDQAKRIAEQELYRILEENKEVTIRVSQKYMYLVPGDVITLRRDDTTIIARIETMTIGANLAVELNLRTTDRDIYL